MRAIFKEWVPEWLIKVILFSGLMPSMVLFFLPSANINVTAGFYGCQPSDVQFLIVLFYAGFVGFYILERRFFEFFPVKQYYIIFNILQIVNCMLMFTVHQIEWVYVFRFIQGMLFASAVNLSISMIFSRLKSERAKEGSYAIFFGMLLCSSPFNTFVTAEFIDSFNFDELYFYAAISFVPGLLMIILTMRNIRQKRAYPLFSLDWASFFLYSILIICIGYILVYGQEMYWFLDNKIIFSTALGLTVLAILFIRQYGLKRVYIHFQVFESRNFILGLIVLYVMYIERFSLSIANQYFVQVIKLDPIHLSYIQWFNILGIVLGVSISLYWLLAKHSIKWTWSIGYCSLLLFHQIMFYSFENDGNDYYFYFPLVLHGLGVGLIMVPTILFAISSVKPQYAISAAAICLAIRYLGYTSNIGIQNFFKLFETSTHHDAFRDFLGKNNAIFKDYLHKQTAEVIDKGLNYKEYTASLKLVSQHVKNESFIRYAMDYYELMSLISVTLLLIILLSPSLKSMYNKLKNNIISPA